MVEVFQEVRRVLREDGTCWINCGDSYNASGRNTNGTQLGYKQATNPASQTGMRTSVDYLKPKDLCGIPWRLAFALQADGWWLRQDIIWHKPNPMPESVTDRCTKAHEYIFLLTKNARYFYDCEAIREPTLGSNPPKPEGRIETHESYQPNGRKGYGSFKVAYDNPAGRNKRSVWTVATDPYSEAHFATFPPDLIKPCILAGTSARGCCPKCGAPWERVIDVDYVKNRPSAGDDLRSRNKDRASQARGHGGWRGNNLLRDAQTTGWQPTCSCGLTDSFPCTCLDPFFGSGTTGMVALELGRKCIGVELNPVYIKLAEQRCHVTPGLALA